MHLCRFLHEYGALFKNRSGIYVLRVIYPDYTGLFKIGSAVSLMRRLLGYTTAFRPILSSVYVYAILVKRRDYASYVDGKRFSVVARAERSLHEAYGGGRAGSLRTCGRREWCEAKWPELRNRLLVQHFGSDDGIPGDGGNCAAYLFYSADHLAASGDGRVTGPPGVGAMLDPPYPQGFGYSMWQPYQRVPPGERDEIRDTSSESSEDE